MRFDIDYEREIKKAIINNRSGLLAENGIENPSEVKTALITFNDYLTKDKSGKRVASLSEDGKVLGK